jgi:hypothetical protein
MGWRYEDRSRPDFSLDPKERRTAYQACRQAHRDVTARLQETIDPNRVYNLTLERKRLAGIAEGLKV